MLQHIIEYTPYVKFVYSLFSNFSIKGMYSKELYCKLYSVKGRIWPKMPIGCTLFHTIVYIQYNLYLLILYKLYTIIYIIKRIEGFICLRKKCCRNEFNILFYENLCKCFFTKFFNLFFFDLGFRKQPTQSRNLRGSRYAYAERSTRVPEATYAIPQRSVVINGFNPIFEPGYTCQVKSYLNFTTSQ